MTTVALNIQQQSSTVVLDGSTRTAAGDREGALFTADIQSKYMQWLLAGKVFETHQAVVATAVTLEANATYDPLEPFFRFTVPSSRTVVPIKVKLVASTAWAAFDRMVVTVHDTDTFNTGGLAGSGVQGLFIDNQGSGNPASSVVTNVLNGDTDLTENAATNLRVISETIAIGTGDPILEYNVLKGDSVAAIHGPASFLVNVEAAGAEEIFYQVVWAELDKNYLVNN